MDEFTLPIQQPSHGGAALEPARGTEVREAEEVQEEMREFGASAARELCGFG